MFPLYQLSAPVKERERNELGISLFNAALTGWGLGKAMVYDPGALNASLAAAVGSDPSLMADLRAAFIDSAARQLDLMGRARCDANWQNAASRLKSLAGSFGAVGLMALADEALDGAPGDPVVLRKIDAAILDFASA
jgi:HPt (histidine-containing phosphotransfer) domain-containing protein